MTTKTFQALAVAAFAAIALAGCGSKPAAAPSTTTTSVAPAAAVVTTTTAPSAFTLAEAACDNYAGLSAAADVPYNSLTDKTPEPTADQLVLAQKTVDAASLAATASPQFAKLAGYVKSYQKELASDHQVDADVIDLDYFHGECKTNLPYKGY